MTVPDHQAFPIWTVVVRPDPTVVTTDRWRWHVVSGFKLGRAVTDHGNYRTKSRAIRHAKLVQRHTENGEPVFAKVWVEHRPTPKRPRPPSIVVIQEVKL